MKKTATIFLILALVMSFFVSCNDSAGGSAEGFFPVVRKVPGDNEKATVWELTRESIDYLILAFEVADHSYSGTLEEAINDAFEQSGIDLICDGKQTIEINNTTKVADYVLAFKSKNSNDVVVKTSGRITSPKQNETLDVFKVSYKTAKNNLIAEGSLQLSSDYILNFTAVNLNNVEYEPSEFSRANPTEEQKLLSSSLTSHTAESIAATAYFAYLNKGEKTTEAAINEKFASLFDEQMMSVKLICREGGVNSITKDNDYATIKLDLVSIDRKYPNTDLSLKAAFEGYINSETDISLTFDAVINFESGNTGKIELEAAGKVLIYGADNYRVAFDRIKLNGVDYSPFTYSVIDD